jgi:hypothetical protein
MRREQVLVDEVEVAMKMKNTLFVVAAALALPLFALAEPPVTRTEVVEVSARIEAIDHDLRLVTLKDAKGNTQTLYCGPDVKRFEELKVGDTVSFRYQESVAYSIRKPGQPSAVKATDSEPKVTPGKGQRPGGTVSQQVTATVTIKAVDAKVPSVTVLTEDGRTTSFRVENPKNVEGLGAGDKVEITYTQAVVIAVK